MAHHWEKEAIHEQFDIFDQLSEPYSSYSAIDLTEITNKVNNVVKKQLRMDSIKTPINEKYIIAEFLKAKEKNMIRMSYVVIVTNEDTTNGSLSKIPVFRVLVQDEHTFVDISGSVYKSWEAFMKNNDLPACKFCYPVNGYYDVKKNLKIDYALSPAACLPREKLWFFVGAVVVNASVLAACFYFNIAPIVSRFCLVLLPIAEKCFPKILSDLLRPLQHFASLIEAFKVGKLNMFELTSQAYTLLSRFHLTFQKEIFHMWEETKKLIPAAYNYLHSIFSKYFKRASNESQHTFFANVVRVEEEISKTQEKAGLQLNEMNRGLASTETSICTLGANGLTLSYNQLIFQSCRSESTYQCKIKEYDCNLSQMKPTTESLLVQSNNLANQLKAETLSDVLDIFESLSCIVKDEYKNKIDNYIKSVHAAMAAAGHNIDLDIFNKSLGIVGDPKDHYMEEAIQSVQKPRLSYQLKQQIKLLRMDHKIYLIPIFTKSVDDDVGVYKTIGVRGKGKFSAQWLQKVLMDSFIKLKEISFVVNETNSVIYLRSNEISIFAYQEVNDENTSEGIVYFNRNES